MLKDLAAKSFLNFWKMWNQRWWMTRKEDNMWNEEWKKTVRELKTRNLSLRLKCSFSKINSPFFCPAIFYSTFISALLKVALKNFKRMLLVHRFDRFFCFLPNKHSSWREDVFKTSWRPTNVCLVKDTHREKAP